MSFSPRRRALHSGLVVSIVACAVGGCVDDGPRAPDVPFAQAHKVIGDVTVLEHVVAFTDGVEASSDKNIVGPSVRALRDDGSLLVETEVTGGIRGVALLDSAVATLELTSTIADQHVVIRPFAGQPVSMQHEHIPIALAATTTSFVWVEAAADILSQVVDLTLVEVDPRGEVVSRTHVGLPDDARHFPVTALQPFPDAFGILVERDAVHLGWSPRDCDRSSEVLRVLRANGEATVEWRGAVSHTPGGADSDCSCDATAVDEVGQKLALLNGDLIVVGSTFGCAAVSPNAGFIARRGETIHTGAPLSVLAANGTSLVVAHGRTLERFDGTLSPLGAGAPDNVRGLALDDANLWIATDHTIFRRAGP
jgi:hypothetical protein